MPLPLLVVLIGKTEEILVPVHTRSGKVGQRRLGQHSR